MIQQPMLRQCNFAYFHKEEQPFHIFLGNSYFNIYRIQAHPIPEQTYFNFYFVILFQIFISHLVNALIQLSAGSSVWLKLIQVVQFADWNILIFCLFVITLESQLKILKITVVKLKRGLFILLRKLNEIRKNGFRHIVLPTIKSKRRLRYSYS